MSYVFRSQFGLVSVSIRSRFSNGSLKTTSQPVVFLKTTGQPVVSLKTTGQPVVFEKPLVNLWFSGSGPWG